MVKNHGAFVSERLTTEERISESTNSVLGLAKTKVKESNNDLIFSCILICFFNFLELKYICFLISKH